MCNLRPAFSASSKGFHASVVTWVVESEVPLGMVLLYTPGTQESIKHGELHCERGVHDGFNWGDVCHHWQYVEFIVASPPVGT